MIDRFLLCDSNNSIFVSPTNPYNFKSIESNELVVTIGDSWTWGADIGITIANPDPCDLDEVQKELRLRSLFGQLVADNIGADFLNLSCPGCGNFFIAERVEEFVKLIPSLNYKKIYIICVFTETGRWFNSIYDLYINYLDFFKTCNNFDQLLALLNRECIRRIQTAVSNFDHVVLKIGTNFVDQIGFDDVSDLQILKPWYSLFGNGPNTYVCSGGVNGLVKIPEFLESTRLNEFQHWMLNIMHMAEQRLNLLNNPKFYKSAHPVAIGHCMWADYILKNLN